MQDSKINKENLEWLLEQPNDTQYELFKNFVEIAKLHYNQLLEEEMREKAGEKYSRSDQYSRWSSNPGSIRVGNEKVKVEVPRLFNKQTGKAETPDYYEKLHNLEIPTEEVLKKVILGLSQGDYEKVTRSVTDSFGLSQSSISRRFIEERSKALEEFEKRDLSNHEFLAIIIDGKYLSRDNVVIALGVTSTGVKVPLGFIQTTTENSKAVKGLLKNLLERGFNFTGGLLALLDGSKGLHKAVTEVFGEFVVIQRCQWHKRENVVSYLSENQKALFRGKLQRAYSEPLYEEAKIRLFAIRDELKKINLSAANSLEEGFEETLTIHRLGLVEELGRSFTTTNIIESLNSQLAKHLRNAKNWVNSEMKSRWVATALLEIETRMKRVNNYKKLNLLITAIKAELKLDQQMVA